MNTLDHGDVHNLPLAPVRPFTQSKESAHREALEMNIRMCGHRCERYRDEVNDVFCRCGEDLTE